MKFEYGQSRREFRARYAPVDVDTLALVYAEDTEHGAAGTPVELRQDLLTWKDL